MAEFNIKKRDTETDKEFGVRFNSEYATWVKNNPKDHAARIDRIKRIISKHAKGQ